MSLFKTISSLTKLLVIFLTTWSIYVSVSAGFGVTVYFPFITSEENFVPYHRWQTVRISVFLTFFYFAILQLLNRERKYLPIKFLEIYLKILTVVGLIIFYKAGVKNTEYLVVAFFGLSSIILHIACRKKQKYFSKKGNKFL